MKIIGRIIPPRIIDKALKRSINLGPALEDIKDLLLDSVEQNFEDEGRPKSWSDLTNSRKRQRARENKWPGKILQFNGGLASSVTGQVDGKRVLVGSGLEYAATHQFGDEDRNIPARPFLLIQDEDVKDAKKILLDHLLGGLRR